MNDKRHYEYDNNKWNSWFYKTADWVRCRDSFIKSTDGCCELCKEAYGKITPGVIVHHHIPLTPENIHDEEISLNHSNLHLLCQGCHNTVHYNQTNRLIVFDNDGQIKKEINLNKYIEK